MRARPARFALCAALCGAFPAFAGHGAGEPPQIEPDIPGVPTSHPLPQSVRVLLPVGGAPVDVNVCADWACALYRNYPVEEWQGDSLVIRQYPALGPVYFGAPKTWPNGSAASVPSGTYVGHAVALYGTFLEHAPLQATLAVTAASRDSPASVAGGVTPFEATRALDEEPEQALAFSAVVVAPDASPGEALLDALDRLVRMGGAVAIPLSSRDRLGALVGDTALEPLTADAKTRLVEIRSQRVLADGPRELHASVARRDGGVVVVYDDGALGETSITDALLAAIPRFSGATRLNYRDVRQTPAATQAGIAVARPVRPLLALLPLGVALALLGVAVRARRSRGALVTRASVVLALGSAAALLVVPTWIDGGGARAEVRTYVSWGEATVALEEGAIAERPPWTGGDVSFTGPAGTVLAAEVRGIDGPLPQRIDALDGGRTVRFHVHGDGVGVAAWLRPVDLEGLRVTSSEGGWPRGVDDLVVESRLPFALDEVRVVADGMDLLVGPVEPGQRITRWPPLRLGQWPLTADGSEPRALAKARLVEDLRERCSQYGTERPSVSCVFGVGTAPDGALVGVQVLSP